MPAEPTPAPAEQPPTAPGKGKQSMVCPHCGTQGQVKTHRSSRTRPMTFWEVLLYLFLVCATLGLAILLLPFARRRRTTRFTKAHCKACGARWTF